MRTWFSWLFACAALLAASKPLAARDTPAESPAAELIKAVLEVRREPFDDARVAGLPAGKAAPVLTWRHAYAIAAARPGRAAAAFRYP